jgi:hypothetical protein
MKTINTQLAESIIAATKLRAERATANAERLYTPEQLGVAYRAMQDGSHQLHPAAAFYLEIADSAWAEYSRLLMAFRRQQRDRRVGQLELAL